MGRLNPDGRGGDLSGVAKRAAGNGAERTASVGATVAATTAPKATASIAADAAAAAAGCSCASSARPACFAASSIGADRPARVRKKALYSESAPAVEKEQNLE